MTAAIEHVKRTLQWPFQKMSSGLSYTIRHVNKENFKELFRRIFILISHVFKLMGIAASVPFFAIEAFINERVKYPKNYEIGNANQAMSSEAIEESLIKIAHPKRKIKSIKIHCTPDSNFDLKERSMVLLKELMPKKISLDIAMPQEALNSMETVTHYYVPEDNHTYALKRKVVHLMLPEDFNEALNAIDQLNDKNERVVNVYYFQPPKNQEKALRQAIQRLHPENILQIHSPFKETTFNALILS